MRFLCLFAAALAAFTNVPAQVPCTDSSIHGTWIECGSMYSPTYDHPPAFINTDSLKKVFQYSTACTNKTWRFNSDGTYYHDMVDIKMRNGRFWVLEKGCKLKVSFRRSNPMRIVYLDDSCMMLWYNNPKMAYIDVYRRYASAPGVTP
jgi:hypothetical protein